MTLKQPTRVRLELPDGGGVIIEDVCALCHESVDSIRCPICQRLFCAELCYGVHLNARDEFDTEEAIDAFLHSPLGRKLVEEAFRDVEVDWKHARECSNCNHELHLGLVDALTQAAVLTAGKTS